MSKTYAVTVSFLDPVEGVAYVGGNSPEEAREKAELLFKHKKDVTIVDIKELPEQVDDVNNLEIGELFGLLNMDKGAAN